MSQRASVLRLYKRVLRLGRDWQSKTGDEKATQHERLYIRGEARTLFRQNKDIGESEIEQKLKEAEHRMAIAVHYRVPYPRPSNVPPMSMAKKMAPQESKAT